MLIDLMAAFGPGRRLVGFAELRAVCASQRVTAEPGDMVCLHTGFAAALLEMGGEPDLQRWVGESGLSVLIADNYAVEAVPGAVRPGRHPFLPLHEPCLFRLGIHLGELRHLSELADRLRKAGRNRFLLTAPPLRLPGAVGSPVTPVATV